MKRIILPIVLLLFTTLTAATNAAPFRDQVDHGSCQYCGMDRVKFGHSRMLVVYQDGSEVGTCSIHCMALEYANAINRMPAKLLTADYNNGELIEAQAAVWVLGGDKPGVMSSRAKWAFGGKQAAEAFIDEHGGELVDFDQAMKASYEDMYADVQRIRKMRAMKQHKMMGK